MKLFNHKLFSFKLKSGALYYTLLISFIISAILAGVLYLQFIQNKLVDGDLMRDKINRNVNSAIHLLLSDPSLAGYDTWTTMNLFDESSDTVSVMKKSWGGFEIINVAARWKNHEVNRSALCGINLFDGDSTAFYLTDENIYLSVCGDSYIHGNVKLPKLGVRRATIEGRFYKHEKEVFGRIGASNASLPAAGKNITDFIKNIKDSIQTGRNLIGFDQVRRNHSIASFGNATTLVFDTDVIYLNNHEFKGNVVICSEKGIRVGSNAVLENIILLAPRIYFEKNFKGCLQAFAEDSLVIADNCYLRFPSVVGISNNNVNQAGMNVGENVTIAGGIFLFQEHKPPQPSIISIEKNSLIFGQVYCNGRVEIKGSIYGSLYCDRIYLRTRRAYYENHLLDATINFMDMPKHFSGYHLFDGAIKTLNLIEWVQ